MGDAAFRGVSAEQDGRFRNKEKVMLKRLADEGQFPAHFDQRVDVKKVNMEVMRQWIAERVGQLLGFEDDVVVEYVTGLLDDAAKEGYPDPRKMHVNLTGFLDSDTATFMSELWTLLLSAQKGIGGIPQEFVEKKKEEMRRAREQDAAVLARSGVVKRDDGRRNGPAGGSRWEEQRRGPARRDEYNVRGERREFVDRSGARTERVRDSGWGARANPREGGVPHPAKNFETHHDPPRGSRDRSRSPSFYERRREGAVRKDSPRRDAEARDARNRRGRSPTRSHSLSPPPTRPREREDGSVTPVLRRRRARSPSVTPPRRSRSPTYSPEPYHTTASSSRRRRSRSRS